MTDSREVIDAYIRKMLLRQHRGEHISEADHRWLIGYVDQGILGMDGFKYCWPEEAKENRSITLASMAKRKTA